jgi:hypothetical protein
MRRLSSVSFDTVAEAAPTSVPEEEQKEQLQQETSPSHASSQNRSPTNIQNLGEKKINATNQARIRATNRNSIGYRLVPSLMPLLCPFKAHFILLLAGTWVYLRLITHRVRPTVTPGPQVHHNWPDVLS